MHTGSNCSVVENLNIIVKYYTVKAVVDCLQYYNAQIFFPNNTVLTIPKV